MKEPCAPEADAELCAASGRACGPLSTADRCGAARAIATCGACAADEVCRAEGSCAPCTPESDAELCQGSNFYCGPLSLEDRCGRLRALACGQCPSPWTCGGDALCRCTGETDAQLCAAARAQCGRVHVDSDFCGVPRDASCGSCKDGETCGTDFACHLRPESDAAFCASQQRRCGAASGVDSAGQPHFVASCGECDSLLSCTSSGHCAVPGESCENPIRLTLDERGHASAAGNFWVTTSDAQSSCAHDDAEPDLVFELTLAEAKRVSVVFKSILNPFSGIRPTLFVRRGCDLGATEVACSAAQVGNQVKLTTLLEAGTWFLWVDGVYPQELGPISVDVDALDRQPPPHDACQGAQPLPAFDADGTATVTDSSLAAHDDAEVPLCGGHGGPDLVYTFEVPTPSAARVSLTPIDWTPVVYVRRGCSDASGPAVACLHADHFAQPVTVDAVGLTPGTYSIWVDGAGPHDAGDFSLLVTLFPGGAPRNDLCSNATPLTFNGGVAKVLGDTRAAGDESTGTCTSSGAPEVYYAFHLAWPRQVIARLTADRMTSSFRGDIQIQGVCGDWSTEYGCDTQVLFVPLLAPGDYYLVVDASDAANPGAFTLEVTLGQPTLEPGCNTPQPLVLDATTGIAAAHGDTRDMYGYAHGSCTPATSQTVLAYRLVMPSPGDASVTITATPGAASALVPEVLLRYGDCEEVPDQEAGCVNAARGGAAVLFIPRLPRGLWYVLVGDGATDGVPSQGTFDLTVQLGPPVTTRPAHDDCSSPEVLAFDPGTGPVTVVRDSAGARSDLWGSCGGKMGGDLVFAFDLTAPSAVRVTATATSPGFAPLVYVSESCGASPAPDERGCATPTGGVAVLTTPRLPIGRHYLVVDDAGCADGGFRLELAPAPSSPDTCGETVPLALVPGQPLHLQGNTLWAADDATRFACAASATGRDVVYQLTTQQTLNVTARLTYPWGARAAVLALRADCADPNEASPCARDPNAASDALSLFAHLLPAGTWYLWVDSATSGAQGQGAFDLQVEATVPAAAPANDRCAAAQAITFTNGYFHATGDLSGARNDTLASCGGAEGPDAVYGFQIPTGSAQQIRAQVIAQPGATGFEPMLYVRRSCAEDPPLSDLACSHDGDATAVLSSLAAGDYYLIVDSGTPLGGPFALSVWLEPAAALPDNCATAMAVDVSGPQHLVLPLDTTLAADDSRSLLCGGLGAGRDLVLTFDTTGLGLRDVRVTAATPSTAVYPLLYLRRTCLATSRSDELECSGASQNTALIVRSIPEGTYYLWVDSSFSTPAGAPMRLDFEVTASPGPPANDACSGAQPLDLTAGFASLIGDLTWATPSGTGCGSGGDLVYSFTLAQTESVTVAVTPDPATPWLRPRAALASTCGSGLGSWEVIDCAGSDTFRPAAVVQARALAAGTYYVAVVSGMNGLEGGFSLEVTRAAPIPSAPGDDCTNPLDLNTLAIGAPLVVNGTTATAHFDEPLTFSAPGAKDLVYRFTLAQPQQRVLVSVTPLSPSYEPALEVRTSCGVTKSYAAAASEPGQAALWFKTNLAAGTWYLWVSSGDASARPTEGEFELRIEAQSGSPGNDTCATARPLTRAVPMVGSTVGACDLISGPLPVSCGGATPIGSDAVYTYTPTASGPFEIIVTASGSGYRPVAWVAPQCAQYSGCMGVAAPGLTNQYRATLSNGVAGQTYYVMVDGGEHTTSGMFALEVR